MLQEQDIILIRNINFKDNNSTDLKLHGHPAVIIHVSENEFYYLKISSHPPIADKPLDCFELKKDKHNKMKRELNYINIRDIYKHPLQGFEVKGYLSDSDFDALMDKFYFYQECVEQDALYTEIINCTLESELKK